MTKKEETQFGKLLLKRMNELQLIMKDVFVVCNILDVKLNLVKRRKK